MLLFLDVETTGLESNDKICSIGLIGVSQNGLFSVYELLNEGKKIPPKASCINHITNEMLQGKPTFKESAAWRFLQEHNHADATIIAHNVNFDMKMLLASGFVWMGKTIDTLRSTKHLIPECDYFSLQFLRYELKLYKEEKKEALRYPQLQNECDILPHNALSDALLTKLLYESLLEIKEHEELVKLTQKNVLVAKLDFGKYSGRYIEEIALHERGYLEWVLSNIADLNEDMRYSIERCLSSLA